MRQIRTQSIGELFRAKLYSTQQAFNDVALVAKQSPRHSAIVAMIGAYLSSFKTTFANSAAISLGNKKGLEVLSCKTSSPSVQRCASCFPFFRIGTHLAITLFLLKLAFFRSRMCTALSHLFGPRVALSTPSLNLWPGIVTAIPGSLRVYVLESPIALIVKVSLPFFRRAFRLSFLGHTESITVMRCVA